MLTKELDRINRVFRIYRKVKRKVRLAPLDCSSQRRTEMINDALTATVIGSAFKVHRTLGSGFRERVYENALRIELEKLGLLVQQQEPINVKYDGHVVGEYYADLLVDGKIIIEVKAAQALVRDNEVQLVNYLTATGLDVGLVINFGSSVQVKRKFREYKPRST
jgi:GxxExxY protein